MAACDNLYGNEAQWEEFLEFLSKTKPRYILYISRREYDAKPEDERRICYIPEIQGWLLENCPIKWVQEQLNENFSVQRMICRKAHHEN